MPMSTSTSPSEIIQSASAHKPVVRPHASRKWENMQQRKNVHRRPKAVAKPSQAKTQKKKSRSRSRKMMDATRALITTSIIKKKLSFLMAANATPPPPPPGGKKKKKKKREK